MRRHLFALLLMSGLGAGTAAQAEPGLIGASVRFQVITYDDPANPLFTSPLQANRVSDGVEFGLRREGAPNELDVVPILVDISATRIELDYSTADPGDLWKSAFNGYVLSFDAACPVIKTARYDPAGTNLPFDNKRIRVEDNSLRLNVSGLSYDRDSRIAVDLTLAECPVN